MLNIWEECQEQPKTCNLYAKLANFEALLNIRLDVKTMLKTKIELPFSWGYASDDHETIVVQQDGIKWFIAQFPEVRSHISSWVLDWLVNNTRMRQIK